MAPPTTYEFTTGHSILPDVGELMYNGCTFSPLFYTEVSGRMVKDAATRTVMYMEYTITADGYVTAPTPLILQDDGRPDDGDTETAERDEVTLSTDNMRDLLREQGGELYYTGRGVDIIVNAGQASVQDVAWGPVPELLEFQPLGGGLSAKVVWKITVRIPDIKRKQGSNQRGLDVGPPAPARPPGGQLVPGNPAAPGNPARPGGGGGGGGAAGRPGVGEFIGRAAPPVGGGAGGAAGAAAGGAVRAAGGLGGGAADGPLLQFNYETSVSYGEDGFSRLSARGTLEIPMTRTPNQKTRTLLQTADDYRNEIERRVMTGIDLTRFRVVKREFDLSRDKRKLEWNFEIEEKPYMDLPPACTVARGNYSVRPSKAGMGLVQWLCTLRCTYTVRGPHREGEANQTPRREAWVAFLALLRWRMAQSVLAPDLGINANQNPPVTNKRIKRGTINIGGRKLIIGKYLKTMGITLSKIRKCFLIDFSFDEGIYLDSKTITFSATWRLVCLFNHLMLAAGVWQKIPERDVQGNNLWATSISDISGQQSWLPNNVDPSLDIVVDFGGG